MLRACILWLLAVAAMSAVVEAAEVDSNHDADRKSCVVRILGVIEPGDEEKFRREILRLLKVDECYIHNLSIYSIGGDLLTAMRIGQQVFTLGLHTHGPSEKVTSNVAPVCKVMPAGVPWTHEEWNK
jgi:hypothetical protein